MLGKTLASSDGTTFNPGDNINGGSGTDTLTLNISGDVTTANGADVASVTLSGIETLNINNYQSISGAGTNSVINLALASGLQTISQSGSSASGDTSVTAVQNLVSAEMKNGSGDLSITYADAAVTGTADTQSLLLSGVTAGTFTVAAAATGGVEVLAVTSSGSAANVLTGITNATTLTKITVAGTQDVTLGTLGAAVVTVDGGASTAGVTLIANTNTDLNITGGSGNDSITTATALAAGHTIDGGNGTDTLQLTADTITDADIGARFTGFETLAISENTGGVADRTQDLSLITGITTAAVTAMNDNEAAAAEADTGTTSFTNASASVNKLQISGLAESNTEAGGGNDFELLATVSLARAVDTTSDAITVELGTSTASAGANVLAATAGNNDIALDVTLNNEETINLVSQGGANFIRTLTSADATTINVSGSKALSINNIDAVNLATLNASGMTANFQISGNTSTVASTITGGSGNDWLDGGTNNDNISGGAGNDTIQAGTGNDVLSGGSGDDNLQGQAGIDNLSGGDGNDTFNVTTGAHFLGLAAAETVSGGAGNDTLSIAQNAATTIVAADLTALSSVETISTDSDANATSITLTNAVYTANGVSNLAITDADGAQGALTVDAGALTGTNSVTVTGNTANAVNDNITAGAGNDTFIFSGLTGLQAADTVAGGTGTDTISLTATAAVTANMSAVTGIERVVTTGNGGDVSITVGANAVIAASATLTVDASSVTSNAFDLTYNGSAITTSTKVQNVTGTAGDDTITGGSGNDIVVGADGADSITGGAGIDNLSGGAGDDRFIVGTAAHFAGLDAVETVSGGAGNDTLAFSDGIAPSITAADLAGISSIEKIEFLGDTESLTVTLTDAVFTSNGVSALTIDATALTTGDLTITASSLSAANSVTVEYENDDAVTDSNITLGAGNDTVLFDADRLDSAFTLTGGSGNDTLTLSDDGDDAGGNTLVATITGFETINFGEDVAFSITTRDANVASGATLTVDGSALITTNALTFNGSAELDGKFSITGGNGADVLTGGAKIDTINGGQGADTLTGGLLADVLSGGLGADTFVYAAVAQSSGTNVDTISDFVSGTDKLRVTLDYSAQSAAQTVNAVVNTAAAGTSAAQDGLSGARGEAVYDTTNSALYINFNADNLLTSSDYKIAINAASTAASTIASGDIDFVITGGSGADSITAGGGADTITAGLGADTITAGAGSDSIVLTEGVASIDTVVFNTAATNGYDLITGFVQADDLINVELLAGGNVAGETAIAADAASTDLTTAFVAVFADGNDGTGAEAIADYTDLTDVAAFLAGSLTEANGETYAAVINDLAGGFAYVYSISAVAGGAIDATEVTLVGRVTIDAAATVANTTFTA